MAKRKTAPRWCFWRGDVLWCRFTVDGKEVRESLRTGSVEIARKRAEEIRARAVGRARYGEIVHTWDDAVVGWADEIAERVSTRTQLRYEQSIRMVSSHLTGTAIKEITGKVIGRIVAARQKAGGAIATVRRDLTAIASVLDYAIDQDWREDNPARERSRRMKENRAPIELPRNEDIEAVLAPLTGRMEDIARFAWATGMRLNEITTMRRSHIKGAKLDVTKAKGNKRRTIDLSEDALAIIRRQSLSLKSAWVFHHDGNRYTQVSTNFGDAVVTAQQTAQKAGREFVPFTFHTLRHVFAVETLRSGRMDIYDLSAHLGHTSVKTTEIYLAFLTPEEVRAAKHGTLDGTETEVLPVPKTA